MEYSNELMVWDCVSIRVTGVCHRLLIDEQAEETSENSMFLFASGKNGHVWVEDTPYIIKTNSLMHIGRNRRTLLMSHEAELEYYLVTYEPDYPQNVGREMTRLLLEGNPFDRICAIRPNHAALIAEQFNRLWDAWRDARPVNRILVKSAFYTMLYYFYAEKVSASSGCLPVDVPQKVCLYLQEHFCETCSIQRLAETTGISRAALHRRFRERVGISPQQYLMTLRMKEAERLLRTTTMTVQEIAACSGYKNRNHFFQVFKQRYGMTPGMYHMQFLMETLDKKEDKNRLCAVFAAKQRVEVESPGRLHRYSTVPQRVVCLSYSAAEICTALGVTDKIVGVSDSEESLADCEVIYRKEIAALTFLPHRSRERRVPGYQSVRALRPDMVIGTSYSFNTHGGVEGAEMFEEDGIHIYALKATCILGSSFEDTYEDIFNLGRIFGCRERAQAIVMSMREKERVLMELPPSEPVRVFSYDGNMGDGAFTCGRSLEDYLIRAAGGINVFADKQSQFVCVSWEEVRRADPQVVLVHRFYDGNDGEEKAAFIKNRPEMAKTQAVKNNNIHIIGIKQVFPGLGNVETTLRLARLFRENRKFNTK